MRNHIGLGAATVLLCLGATQVPASAQPAPYQCVNESIDIDIRPQDMASALDKLSAQTNCPISRDTDLSGLRSNGVRGTYTPVEALKALVQDQGLVGETLRQGLGVKSDGGARADVPAIPYNCQNEPQRISLKAMQLDDALAELSRQTRCPISKDFMTDGLQSRAVKGNLTPVKALQALLKGTGLRAKPVKQGLAVLPARR